MSWPETDESFVSGPHSDRASHAWPCNCSTATACCCANRSPRKMFPADSARSTTCSRLWKRAAAFAAATLSPASAPRSLRCPPRSICCASCATSRPQEKPEFVQLAAADPANPYGSVLRWPDLPVAEEDSESAPRVLTRAAYAEVILRNGQLVAWLRRGNPNLLVFLPAEEPERSQAAAGLAHFLCARGQERMRAAQPSGRAHHHHQRPAGRRAPHGALPHGCGLSSRPAGHAPAPHSAGRGAPRAARAGEVQ